MKDKPKLSKVIHVDDVILGHLSFIIHFFHPFTSHACANLPSNELMH